MFEGGPTHEPAYSTLGGRAVPPGDLGVAWHALGTVCSNHADGFIPSGRASVCRTLARRRLFRLGGGSYRRPARFSAHPDVGTGVFIMGVTALFQRMKPREERTIQWTDHRQLRPKISAFPA